MAGSPALRNLWFVGAVALALHAGFSFIKPIVMPYKKADDANEVLDKLKNI